ncbi:MAG: amino acid racemase [bacterium]
MKRIGILGGMGPAATAELYLAIVGQFQRRFGARYDADFPQMIINSVPAPDVVEKLEDEAELVEVLQQGVRTLEVAGADFVAVACNTVHAFHGAIAAAVSIPVLNLLEETAAAVEHAGHRRVGVLGTGLTIRRGLYREACRHRGIAVVEPNALQQEALTQLILDVLAGGDPERCRGRLAGLIDALRAAGSEAVILGCTDLSGIVPPAPAVVLFDTTRILAEAAVNEATRP